MSQIFSLTDDTYSELAALMYERTGKLPELTAKVKWTTNATWVLHLPLTRTQVKVRKDLYVPHWAIPPGPDNTIHVKITGTKWDNHTKGVLMQYRPKVNLLAKDLSLLIKHIRSAPFNITITRPQTQETLERGDFRPEDLLNVRCAL